MWIAVLTRNTICHNRLRQSCGSLLTLYEKRGKLTDWDETEYHYHTSTVGTAYAFLWLLRSETGEIKRL